MWSALQLAVYIHLNMRVFKPCFSTEDTESLEAFRLLDTCSANSAQQRWPERGEKRQISTKSYCFCALYKWFTPFGVEFVLLKDILFDSEWVKNAGAEFLVVWNG